MLLSLQKLVATQSKIGDEANNAHDQYRGQQEAERNRDEGMISYQEYIQWWELAEKKKRRLQYLAGAKSEATSIYLVRRENWIQQGTWQEYT